MGLPTDTVGVLSPEARPAYKLILFVVGWFIAGVASTIVVFQLLGQPAHAAESGVAAQLASIVTDVNAIKKDVAAIKCRVNLENVCPP